VSVLAVAFATHRESCVSNRISFEARKIRDFLRCGVARVRPATLFKGMRSARRSEMIAHSCVDFARWNRVKLIRSIRYARERVSAT
jgi:hypothetical protein